MSIENQWNLTPAEAIQLQKTLAKEVIRTDEFYDIKYVAGVDVGFEDDGRTTRAAVCVMDQETLVPIEAIVAKINTRFPYIPGLLSFRETPAIMIALNALTIRPDLLLCDGHGYAHPRRFGIACHLGLETDIASIGVGKTLFVGRFDNTPKKRGEWEALKDKDETIGAVLCTRNNVKPIFISSGHKICLATAITSVLDSCSKYRLPEPIRFADKIASRRPSFNAETLKVKTIDKRI